MLLTTTQPATRHFPSLSAHGFHRVAYHEWGDPECARVIVCVHGLTRNGRDFDVLAETLAATHRVLAIDLPGRGESEWLADPSDYAFRTYLTTLAALIARSGAERVDWIGTSLGGLLGMVMAAQRNASIAQARRQRRRPGDRSRRRSSASAAYVGADPTFASFAEAERYIRSVSAPFGELSRRAMAPSHARHGAAAARRPLAAVVRSGARAAVSQRPPHRPTCGTYGMRSRARRCSCADRSRTCCRAATAHAMTQRGPRPRLVEFSGVGHAPALMAPEQIAAIVEFLRT